MPILSVPSSYPPGITGDPYTPNDISVFYDLNWPDHAGLLSTGLGNARIPRGLLSGLGDDGDDFDGSDTGSGITTGSGVTPTLTPAICPSGQMDNGGGICIPIPTTGGTTDSNAACGAGWTIVLDSNGNPICQQNSSTSLNTPLTPAQAGLTPAQQAQLIAATGNSAVSLIRTAAGGPYTVAGTNLVYNPATGQLTTSAGANATALASSIGAYLPMIGLGLAAILIIPKLLGGK
jgi:hypothetical protein